MTFPTTIRPEEMADLRHWMLGQLESLQAAASVERPFSFIYGGRPSAQLLQEWPFETGARQLDEQRTEHTLTWTDPATGLMVRWVIVLYADFPTVEWTLSFRNGGAANTPILEDIQAFDAAFARAGAGEFILHHNTGSPCRPDDYQPFRTTLWRPALGWRGATAKRITTSGGRPTNSDLPYFNLEWENADGAAGAIVVIGWPGQWAAEFTRTSETAVHVRAGQELTHFVLHPNEEVRGPLMVVQFWRGDHQRSQNIWRRWMLAYNTPRNKEDQVPEPQVAACSSHQYSEMIHADSASQKLFIDRYLAEQLRLDYWWMDAGWYWNIWGWPNTGTWEVDTDRFPGGLRPISDHAHAQGVDIIVWFEPERVTPGTWLYDTHPEWLLTLPQGPDTPPQTSRASVLLNMGDPAALRWLIDHIDRFIAEQGIDLYRQDYNIDPLPFWLAHDAPDRQGITEIKYVTGYLAYWDALRSRHPGMLIDTCASGGRRNDIETLRRAVPLLRSDYIFQPTSNQCQTYGIAAWIPFYGTGTIQIDPYIFRSEMCPHITYAYDMRRDDLDYNLARQMQRQWQEHVAPNYYGDYYPLTSYSLEEDVWLAWQFDRPESGQGVVQVFRRPHSPYTSASFRLHALDPDARYMVTNVDTLHVLHMMGRALMEEGVPVAVAQAPSALILTYRRE